MSSSPSGRDRGLDDSFHVFDTTLRDGAQRKGINLTVADKLAIARHLDDFGVGFIEGGWPGASPRDTEFFARARQEIDFRHARLVAFGCMEALSGLLLGMFVAILSSTIVSNALP
ncbi:hypothetical protein ABZS63_15975, partial [Streptomyces sp. NPDC005568]